MPFNLTFEKAVTRVVMLASSARQWRFSFDSLPPPFPVYHTRQTFVSCQVKSFARQQRPAGGTWSTGAAMIQSGSSTDPSQITPKPQRKQKKKKTKKPPKKTERPSGYSGEVKSWLFFPCSLGSQSRSGVFPSCFESRAVVPPTSLLGQAWWTKHGSSAVPGFWVRGGRRGSWKWDPVLGAVPPNHSSESTAVVLGPLPPLIDGCRARGTFYIQWILAVNPSPHALIAVGQQKSSIYI